MKKTIHELIDRDGISLFKLATNNDSEAIESMEDFFENESYYSADNFDPEYFVSGLVQYYKRRFTSAEYKERKQQGYTLWFKLDSILENLYHYYLRHVYPQDVNLDKDTFPALFVDDTGATYKLECKVTGYIMSLSDVLFHMEDKMVFDSLISSSQVVFTAEDMHAKDKDYFAVEDSYGNLTKETQARLEEHLKNIKLKN